MGYINHNAIVVSSWDKERILIAHEKAKELLPDMVTELVHYRVNGGSSFLVGPDGSKEGWDESDLGDQQRNAFVDWLNQQRYEDNSTWLSWVEIAYSSDDRDASVTRHAWQVDQIDD